MSDDDTAATCRNCDKPIPGGDYCGRLCEDMYRLPVPRDDRDALMGGAS